MMSEKEQEEWANSLASTRQEQIKIIRNLLQHANTDGMSGEDRVVCRHQLWRLCGSIQVPVFSWSKTRKKVTM